MCDQFTVFLHPFRIPRKKNREIIVAARSKASVRSLQPASRKKIKRERKSKKKKEVRKTTRQVWKLLVSVSRPEYYRETIIGDAAFQRCQSEGEFRSHVVGMMQKLCSSLQCRLLFILIPYLCHGEHKMIFIANKILFCIVMLSSKVMLSTIIMK